MITRAQERRLKTAIRALVNAEVRLSWAGGDCEDPAEATEEAELQVKRAKKRVNNAINAIREEAL